MPKFLTPATFANPSTGTADTNLYRSTSGHTTGYVRTDGFLRAVQITANATPSSAGGNLLYAGGTNPSTGTTTSGLGIEVTAPATTTVWATGASIQARTAAAAFTLAKMSTVRVAAPNIGAGSTVTTLYGVEVEAMSGAGSNYGIAVGAASTQTLWLSSDANNTTAAAGIAFGSSRDTNLYRYAADALRTDDTFVVGPGTPSATGDRLLHIGGASPGGGASQYGVTVQPTGSSEATTRACALYVQPATSAASFTAGTVQGLWVRSPTIGSGSSITDLYGIQVDAQAGATHNYGIAIGAASTQTLWISNNANNTTAAAGIAFGSSRDTNLYRSGSGALTTDGSLAVSNVSGNGLAVNSTAAGYRAFLMIRSGEANGRFGIIDGGPGGEGGGRLEWGPGGSTAVDTNLYRSAADTLKTDDSLSVGAVVGIPTVSSDTFVNLAGTHPATGGSTYGLYSRFVTPSTSTTRSIGARIKMESAAASFTATSLQGLWVETPTVGSGSTVTNVYGINIAAQTGGTNNYGIAIAAAGTYTLWVGNAADSTAASAGVTFGLSGDTNLYRRGADWLRTDDDFQARRITVGSSPQDAYLCYVAGTHPGTTATVYGVLTQYTGPSTATSGIVGGYYQARSAAASFTVTDLIGLQADAPTVGSGSTATNAYGVKVEAQTGATNNYGVAVGAAGTQTLWLSSNTNSTAATGGIAFGSSRDTNLYRSAADTLKTDDALVVASTLAVGTTPATSGTIRLPNSAGITFRNAGDTANIQAITLDFSNSVLLGPVVGDGGVVFTNRLFSPYGGINMPNGTNLTFSTSTGTKIGTGTTEKIGWWNATPVAQSTGWSATAGYTSSKSFDPETASLLQTSRVLGTLLDQLKTYGLLGA